MMSDAIGRLKDAAAFNRGDVAVLNALGDALFALADLSGPALTQEILERALQEGFQAALLIDRNQSDALIGVAEVNLQLGRRELCKAPPSHLAKASQLHLLVCLKFFCQR